MIKQSVRTVVSCDRCGVSGVFEGNDPSEGFHTLATTNLQTYEGLLSAHLCAKCLESLRVWLAPPEGTTFAHDTCIPLEQHEDCCNEAYVQGLDYAIDCAGELGCLMPATEFRLRLLEQLLSRRAEKGRS